MLKNFSVLFFLFALCCCQHVIPVRQDKIVTEGGSQDMGPYGVSPLDFLNSENNFKVAMLLPLTGKTATYGTGLKNAAMMALEDAKNSRLVIRFYDTQSTSSGAAAAARQATDDGNVLIIGPLIADEVSAAGQQALRKNIPVISFSTSPNVLQEGIYTLGLLGAEQVDRVVAHAVNQQRRRIALLLPDTTSGKAIARDAVQSVSRYGAEIVKIGFYPPTTLDFADIVKQMTDYDTRSAEINKQKQELQVLADAGDKNAEQELKKLKTTYTTGDIDFDALLIPESGNRLKSAIAMFGYYDISYPTVLFMGTSVWENTNLSKETSLYNGIYPVISRVHNDYFNQKYEKLFGEKPNQLYSFAYDGVALASAISQKDTTDLKGSITNEKGYIGINGAFRILPDGTNQHSLDMVKVTENGPKVIDSANKKFAPIFNNNYSITTEMLPKIYGKSPELVYKQLYYSAQENPFFSMSGFKY